MHILDYMRSRLGNFQRFLEISIKARFGKPEKIFVSWIVLQYFIMYTLYNYSFLIFQVYSSFSCGVLQNFSKIYELS